MAPKAACPVLVCVLGTMGRWAVAAVAGVFAMVGAEAVEALAAKEFALVAAKAAEELAAEVVECSEPSEMMCLAAQTLTVEEPAAAVSEEGADEALANAVVEVALDEKVSVFVALMVFVFVPDGPAAAEGAIGRRSSVPSKKTVQPRADSEETSRQLALVLRE